MDRFNSDEEVEWASGCFYDGGLARSRNGLLTDNPHEPHTWAWKSWNAGWADMDQGLSSSDYVNFYEALASKSE